MKGISLLALCFSLLDGKSFAEDQKKEKDMITLDMTVGDIVAQKCSLARVFEKYKIDYCCGGKQALNEVCIKKGLDPQGVLKELNSQMSVQTDEKSWNKESLNDLIDHIQARHHAYLWSELSRIAVIVEKVAKVHGAKHPELIEVRDIYIGLQSELEEHLRKEETVIFPAIRKLEAASHTDLSDDLLAVLEHEHDDTGEAFHHLRDLTHDFDPPEGACNTYRVMLSRLEELESDMHQHVHKENSILFPRCRQMIEKNNNKIEK